MPEHDPTPKLRVIEDQEETPAEGVVRLGPEKPEKAPNQRLQQDQAPTVRPIQEPRPAPNESPARLESATRDYFDGRSVEPGVEAILDQQVATETIETPWGGQEKRVSGIPYGWFLLIGLVVAGAGLWSILQTKKGEKNVAAAHETVREKVEKDEQKDAAARDLVAEVEKVVRSYLAADTIEDIVPLIRQPERVRPLIEKEWQTKPKVASKFRRLAMFQPATIEGKPFWVIRAEVENSPPENLLLEQTGDAEVKVDWETQVCHQPMPWNDYVSSRPSGQSFDFRVTVERDNFFSHEFSDASKWRCFRIGAKNSVERLFGYAPADSEIAKFLEAYCAGAPRKTASVILRLRFLPEAGSPRGVVIEKVVAPRWVYLKDPTDAP